MVQISVCLNNPTDSRRRSASHRTVEVLTLPEFNPDVNVLTPKAALLFFEGVLARDAVRRGVTIYGTGTPTISKYHTHLVDMSFDES